MTENNCIKQWGKEGKVLVFLHYFGGSAQSWRWVSEKLMDTFHCICFNIPGFGGTPSLTSQSIQSVSEYLQHQLNFIGVKNYYLIGHSMGAKIAMQMAANAGKSVEQLILIAPSPPSYEPVTEDEKEKMLRKPDRTEAINTIASISNNSLKDDQYLLAVNDQLAVDDAARKWWVLEGVDHSIVDSAKLLRLPIAVIASEDDTAIAFSVINDLVVDFFPQSHLIITRNLGHLLPMEAPDWVAMQIKSITMKTRALDFLDSD